jgi:hypothetical protein
MHEKDVKSPETDDKVEENQKTRIKRNEMKQQNRDKSPPQGLPLPMIIKENGQMVVDEECDIDKDVVFIPETGMYVTGKVYGESSFNNMPLYRREAIEYIKSSEDEVDEEDETS